MASHISTELLPNGLNNRKGGCYLALTSSMEDYLEAVYILFQKQGDVRCVDVAEYLEVTKPSVSRAVKELTKAKYLRKDSSGILSLTSSGEQVAAAVYERHCFFMERLIAQA